MAEQFVKMTKDGETIKVSPLVVENHKQLGWKVVEGAKAEAKETSDAEAKAAEAKAILEAKK